MFIVFDGLDGCGKDTQLKAVKESLEEQGLKVKIFGNVDSGPLARDIRRILNPETKLYIDNFHLSILMLTNMKLIHENIKKAEEEGYIALCGRWIMTSMAYGGYDQSLDRREVLENVIAQFDIKPDLTFYLNVPVTEANRRIQERCCSAEIYDKEDKLSKIKEMFDKIHNSSFYSYANYKIDSLRNKEDITADIMEVITSKLQK